MTRRCRTARDASQTVRNQQAEIEFRRRLVEQQLHGKVLFEDEFDAAGIEALLAGRVARTRAQMESLSANGVVLSPYIEIGAERAQRALVLENEFNAHGAALDISYHMLASAPHYAKVLRRPRLPLRICGDAYRLPFRTGSVPFVFCYQTLHHFPDPAPVVAEAFRVLSPGGRFLFDEEPYRQVLHLDLYTRKTSICAATSRRPTTLQRIVDRFLVRHRCNESDFGIVENHDIPVADWRRALGVFPERDVALHTLRSATANLDAAAFSVSFALACLLGGSISGVCRKSGEVAVGPSLNGLPGAARIEDSLVCPSCREPGAEAPIRVPADGRSARCDRCRAQYPIVNGVAFLLRGEQCRQLYPDIGEGARPPAGA